MRPLSLPPWLLPLLACPRCQEPLETDAGARCPTCGARFPERNGLVDLRVSRERIHLWAINRLPPVAQTYDLWRMRSTALLSRGRLSLGEELELMRGWLLPTGGPFLDVGTGTGIYRETLGEKAVGLDPSPAFLQVARQRRPGPYLLGHGEALPFRTGSMGGVAIGPTWNEFTYPEGAMREARRVLRSGGRLFGMLLLGPGPSLGLWRPGPEEFVNLLRTFGFRAHLETHGALGILLAQAP
ncbi:MAG: methyltransferase domain-containing protein [Thermus sp.]